MSQSISRQPSTVGSSGFDPDEFFGQWADGQSARPENNDLQDAIRKAFHIPKTDAYIYHAVASVTLSQVQRAIDHGASHGLHAWYIDGEGKQIPTPPATDIEAYTSIFLSTTSTTKALTAFEKNAKKASTREAVARHLVASRLMPADIPVPKLKKPQVNPYLDFWIWSCQNLEWCGPDEATVNVRQSHHILPVFYHHFGCVCPSFEALDTIRHLARGKKVLELGSGNGYWTYMLRSMGAHVTAVDNGDSLWRTIWIPDTIKTDASHYLQKHAGCKDAVLLLVYPQVSTDFTRSVLKNFQGTTICVAGTQNANGFTAFEEQTVDRYFEENKPDFKRIVQTPLPSFAAKDEALFCFRKDP